MRVYFLCTLVFFLGSALGPANAQAETTLSPLRGAFSHTLSSYLQPVYGLSDLQDHAEIELEETLSSETYGAKFVPWVRVWALDTAGGTSRRVRPFFEAREAWVERIGETLDLRLGNQILSWGAADQINPTDVWNSVDLRDPFQSVKLPATVALFKLHPPARQDIQLEVVATPFFRESRLPLDWPETGERSVSVTSSRWLPLPANISTNGLSVPTRYTVHAADFPQTFQGALRAKALRVSGWDFSAMTFHGVEKVPRFAGAQTGNANDPTLPLTLHLYPSFHRTAVYGFDGTGPLRLGDTELGLRFEAAYAVPSNRRAAQAPAQYRDDLTRSPYLQVVAGGDYTVPGNFLGTTVYLNLQYVHYHTFGEAQRTRPGITIVSGMPNLFPFDRNLVFYFEDRVSSKFKFSNTLLVSIKNKDGMESPAFHVTYKDNWKAKLGADFFFGSSAGFYGQFADNRRITFGLSYVF